ncbi:MAG: hypothetical protein QM704_04840 [Anaeromyxobacteraceae bacterium]
MKKHRFGIAVALGLGTLAVVQLFVQQRRYTIAVHVMSELVEEIRNGRAKDVRHLEDGDVRERNWMQSPFTVHCDLVPPFSWTRFACVARFDDGGSAAADVDTKTGRILGARVLPPRRAGD